MPRRAVGTEPAVPAKKSERSMPAARVPPGPPVPSPRCSRSSDGSEFAYGDFINAVLTFLIVAAVVFFLVVKPVNTLMARLRTEPDVDSKTRLCPECLSQIPVAAARCAFCTTEVPAIRAA
jgi:large-conductance mechanosensitive channel MscL